MSNINVNYDLHYTPDPIDFSLQLYGDGAEIKVKMEDVPKVVVVATPSYSEDIGSDILSTIGTPMADMVSASLGAFTNKLLDGMGFTITTVPSIDLNVEGKKITLTPGKIEVSNYNGMLMATGTVDIK